MIVNKTRDYFSSIGLQYLSAIDYFLNNPQDGIKRELHHFDAELRSAISATCGLNGLNVFSVSDHSDTKCSISSPIEKDSMSTTTIDNFGDFNQIKTPTVQMASANVDVKDEAVTTERSSRTIDLTERSSRESDSDFKQSKLTDFNQSKQGDMPSPINFESSVDQDKINKEFFKSPQVFRELVTSK